MIQFLFLLLVVISLKLIPLKWIRFFSKILGTLVFKLDQKQRKRALASLKIAFPDKNEIWHQGIAKKFFIEMLGMPLETLYYLKTPEKLVEVEVEGKEYLDLALEKGKGVIGLTAHMGYFPIMHLKLAYMGYSLNVMTRPIRDTRIGNYFNLLRKRANIKTIYSLPKREAVEKTIKALRRNELVIIQMDQDYGADGVMVEFFGKLASTPYGPIMFSLRTGSCLLPMIIVRQNTEKHKLIIFPELMLDKAQDKEDTIKLNILKYNRLLEGWIRAYPYQWGWIHQRWKS